MGFIVRLIIRLILIASHFCVFNRVGRFRVTFYLCPLKSEMIFTNTDTTNVPLQLNSVLLVVLIGCVHLHVFFVGYTSE